ncbi:energy transducer TonB [Xenorhabdus bovienii]|uniref:Energy transducer TonB n=1 Tax=Xenorhabdus bovienii TaxID=40576 RepID=A0AAJ1J693_XENBV|nr:energy transducer TonB [Xenorhabdus bovienii]MDE1476992.1 energy transducer TonB [Xenorhabdus bovienii]MDE1491269.1 energy transducer TonB [Xenorhabdus bovienii]MDE9431200.1 energy transducer TonB [Xenorhabdus bovienii]MDE9488844.1 energy transducer TonB [Xenorhabdus bovienii]MDE9505225.1 energy transducer TonB [Xenorhabdus bovienii]
MLTYTTYQTTHVGHVTKSFLAAITLHALLVGWFIYTPKDIDIEEFLPPPAVMVELSLQTEAIHKIQNQPIGIEQQLSVASQQQEGQVDEVNMPKLDVNENAHILVHKPKKKQKEQEIPKKTQPVKRVKAKERESEKSRSSVAPTTSSATADNIASRTAASYESNSDAIVDAKTIWQAEVSGHLNRYKKYPPDAQRRNRTGRPMVKFTVNQLGTVIDSELIQRSGTNSLDREARLVLERAQPLPLPPDVILTNGRVTVELPIDFYLSQ